MNSIETPFEQLLFEHRISPPPAFSAGVDVALAKILREESRAMKSTQCGKERNSRGGVQRVLLLVASLLIVLGLSVLAIPSARAVVSNWIGGYFSAEDYLGKTGENRKGEPALDSIIRKIEPDGRELVISDILNTEQARQLANDFGIRLGEITYRGMRSTSRDGSLEHPQNLSSTSEPEAILYTRTANIRKGSCG